MYSHIIFYLWYVCVTALFSYTAVDPQFLRERRDYNTIIIERNI